MIRSLAERKHNLARLPWVRVLRKPVPCEGIKWDTVALKDIFRWGPGNQNPPRGIQPKSRCKKLAYWHYKALGSTPAESGNFCFDHLSSQLFNEQARVNRWFDRYGWEETDGS